jgi:hypothetical protein
VEWFETRSNREEAAAYVSRTLANGSPPEPWQLEQIQFLLGHASVQTTERYIGSKQQLQDAVNDRLEISVAGETACPPRSLSFHGGSYGKQSEEDVLAIRSLNWLLFTMLRKERPTKRT